ncbi:MAG: 2-C-methyl-D-erythritol 2,4-cyclodiphosphate synthase [Candidatus Marinimicrobia bacterium]|nr:2-C-methyl-D-erythritol 2,4-cyclodiphosphate synthase [Candidatus Neomarinimicrobiota bacterium]
MNQRVGIGYDVHQLGEGRSLILGGVEIHAEKGVVAHSDGDVIAHAIGDALLGAANLGDIGQVFPSNDPSIAGISGSAILQKVRDMLDEHDYSIGNIDVTLILQTPKIASYVSEMKTNLCNSLGVESGAISVKATTTDHLGYAGQGEGIAAMAVALVQI